MQEKTIISNENSIPNTHYFVYKSQNYPIKFVFFKYASKYFSENKKQLKQTQYIQLVDKETMNASDFKPEWIEDFINFVQGKKVTLDESNVLCLNYLSNIYEIDTLQKVTNEYISTNQEDLVLKILYQHQNDSKIDTSHYEKTISSKIEQFIENDELLKINIPILQRIINKFFSQNKQLKKDQTDKFLSFFMKCLDKYGSLASVLFNEVEIVKSSPQYLDKFMNDYSNVFDFNFLNKNDFVNLYNEKKKQESEFKIDEQKYQAKISLLEKQLENDKEGLQIKIDKCEQEKEKLEQNEIALKSEISKLQDEVKKLKHANSQNMQKQEEQKRGILFEPSSTNFTGIINHLRKNIDQIDISASSFFYNQIDKHPINVTKFEDYTQAFLSDNKPNSWICLDFKEHRIIPTHYTLKSTTDYWISPHPKNWIFEGSVDYDKWKTLDEQKDCVHLHGYNLIYTFKVQHPSEIEFRYIRVRSTGQNWDNSNYLLIDSIEIYGRLI